jgi:hypothetical protein
MSRWLGVVPQGCVLLFLSFFVVIFWALCCDFLGGVLRMISWVFCWVSRMRTLCLFGWWLCPQNLPWIGLDLVVFRVARVLALESQNLRFLLIVSDSGRFLEVSQEITQLFPKFRCNPWSDSGDRAMGNWGWTCGYVFWKGRPNHLGGRSNCPTSSRWRFWFCRIFSVSLFTLIRGAFRWNLGSFSCYF